MQGHIPEKWILQLHHHASKQERKKDRKKKLTKCHSFYTFTSDLGKFNANRYNKTSWSFAPVIIMMAITGQQPRTTQN